ncbi:MAG: hypothetical protein FD123_4098 [Bacteroidetes bacterium]|nr:MAG: hypothetical protein FD123_4098 [Bacteroidota bacterium]
MISDRKGNPLISASADEVTGNFMVNLEAYPEDIYKIKTSNGPEKIFLLLHHDQKYEGIVLMETSNDDQNITIKFPSRNIYWEYVVVSKYDEYKELSMVEESGKIIFNKTAHSSIDNAFSFTSSEPVTLKDRYELSFQLEDNGRVVKKNIPNGDMKNVDKCLINVHNFCLKNYVSV